MKGTDLLRIFLALLWCAWSVCDVRGQIFRRVTAEADIEVGARYLLTAPVYGNDNALYVVVRQETTGTGVKKRTARVFDTDEQKRVHAADTDIALFELGREGTNYTLRDVHNGGYLTYSTKKVSAINTALYTMSREEVAAAPSSVGTLCQTFKFDFSLNKTCITTARKVATSTSERLFCLLPSHGVSDIFRLYERDDAAGTLYLYKEISAPSLENEESGDWTFRGDWSAENLSARDFSKASRIDFTSITLPEDWKEGGETSVSLPGDFVWTYVRWGEGDRLPEGWPNVIEVDFSESPVRGRAVTTVRGSDACVMPPKYPFRTKKGVGISWWRDVPADGGWLTAGLPFPVQTCTWETADGPEADIERRAFAGWAGQGVVFREMKAEESAASGMPFLWRPKVPRQGKICFHADEADVQTGDADFPAEAGFYASFRWRDVEGTAGAVYLLDDRGEKFVRAAAGSRIAPGRGYLYVPKGAAETVRLLTGSDATACHGVKTDTGGLLPLYTLMGVKAGEWRQGEPLPDSLPSGIYVTPVGKVVKP